MKLSQSKHWEIFSISILIGSKFLLFLVELNTMQKRVNQNVHFTAFERLQYERSKFRTIKG